MQFREKQSEEIIKDQVFIIKTELASEMQLEQLPVIFPGTVYTSAVDTSRSCHFQPLSLPVMMVNSNLRDKFLLLTNSAS